MADKINYQYLETPLGQLRLVSDGEALLRIEFADQHGDDGVEQADAVLHDTARQLTEYFQGQRQRFQIKLGAEGTAFQNSVWQALREIPYGELRSYQDIANSIGRQRAVRAVGAANGRNPIPIVVPCHRVIGSNGRLTGFAGGLPAKQLLLSLEGSSVG